MASIDRDERESLVARAAALIDGLAGGDRRDDSTRDALLVDIARWQAQHVGVYRRLVENQGRSTLDGVRSPAELPAVPTDVFRMARVAAHGSGEDVRTFLTSGTTSGARGAHHLRTLELYDRAARAAGAWGLFPDRRRLPLVNLVAAEEEAPESSLSYMVARFVEWFGTGESVHVWREGRLDLDLFASTLDRMERAGAPVALLGTSFAFVLAEDALGARRWRLAGGSRIMQTGGYKGRSREVDPAELRELLAARYGVASACIVAEYGMTELSSQMYETTLAPYLAGAEQPRRRLCAPAWMRVVVTDPDTLSPLADGEVGLIRIEDPANIDTCWAIQTSDLGRRVGDAGLEVLGRASGATPRGCSLAVEESLRA